MRKLLLVVLVLACIWDGFTTIYGTNQILANGGNALIVSIIFSIVLLVFLMSTSYIWQLGWTSVFGFILRILLVLAILYDVFTSYYGNAQFILEKNPATVEQVIVLIGISIFVSGSPILLSFFIKSKQSS